MNRSKGFTLVELITVIAIIGILTAIITANLADSRARARDAQRVADIERIALALETYRQAYGEYPKEADSMNGIVGEGAGVDALLLPIMGSVPHDPLGPGDSEYKYYYDARQQCPDISNRIAVVFATTMEQSSNNNYAETLTLCSGTIGNEGRVSGNESYNVIVGLSSG